jgi:hypothetical protein
MSRIQGNASIDADTFFADFLGMEPFSHADDTDEVSCFEHPGSFAQFAVGKQWQEVDTVLSRP